MGRDLSFLNERDVRNIKEWLRYEDWTRDNDCPFSVPIYNQDRCVEICEKIFPSLERNACPCKQFGLEYATEVAREIVSEFEKRKER